MLLNCPACYRNRENTLSENGGKQIGLHDDFYRMGDDLLKTIILIIECKQLHLESSDVYKYRMPERIAAFYDANKNTSEKFSSVQAMEEKFFPKMRET